MSAINFVVRDVAGNISKGSVAGEGFAPSLMVGAGSDISLNLSQGQIASYTRQGQSLEVTLIDGRVIVIEGYFTTDGTSENQLFLSTDGSLTEVDLTQGAGADYYAYYIHDNGMGKLSANDELYFMRSSDVILADGVVPVDGEVGMLGLALGGLAPLFGLGGAAAVGAAAVGVAALASGGDDDSAGSTAPVVAVNAGTETADVIVNQGDYADGVGIGGTGTPDGTVAVTVQGTTETTTVNDDGTWAVTFDPTAIEAGENETPVEVTITTDSGSTTVTDMLVIDTIIGVDMMTAGGADGIVNGVENAAGVTLSGAVTGGGAVVVTIKGVDYNAVVTGATWTLDVPTAVLGQGEYSEVVTVTATDAAGNVASTTSTVVVDTVTTVTLDTSGVGGSDNVVNGAEQQGGVTLTGAAQPGASVVVTMGGIAQTVTATSDGTWSASYTAAQVPTGEQTLAVTAVATDTAGNTASASGSVTVDTVVQPHEWSATAIEGDNIINAAEAADGVVLSGTTEAGSSIVVQFGGESVTVVSGANGAWSANFSAGSVQSNTETMAGMTATATDIAGNVSVITQTVQIDTFVNNLTATDPVEGNNVVSRAEAADGVTLNGTVEAGSSVVVTFAHPGGVITQNATVDASGNWSVTYASSQVPAGEYDANITISATDANGNTASITDTFKVDTIAPDAPGIEFVGLGNAGVEEIKITATTNDVTVTEVTASNATKDLKNQDDGTPTNGDTKIRFEFDSALPNGSHLVVTESDNAGNANATYLVLEESSVNVVDTGGLDNFNIGAIELGFAKDSELTLDLATLEVLSDTDNNLVIHGGADDSVTINGAADSGANKDIGGKSYDVYTMGDEAQIFIEEGVNVTI